MLDGIARRPERQAVIVFVLIALPLVVSLAGLTAIWAWQDALIRILLAALAPVAGSFIMAGSLAAVLAVHRLSGRKPGFGRLGGAVAGGTFAGLLALYALHLLSGVSADHARLTAAQSSLLQQLAEEQKRGRSPAFKAAPMPSGIMVAEKRGEDFAFQWQDYWKDIVTGKAVLGTLRGSSDGVLSISTPSKTVPLGPGTEVPLTYVGKPAVGWVPAGETAVSKIVSAH